MRTGLTGHGPTASDHWNRDPVAQPVSPTVQADLSQVEVAVTTHMAENNPEAAPVWQYIVWIGEDVAGGFTPKRRKLWDHTSWEDAVRTPGC